MEKLAKKNTKKIRASVGLTLVEVIVSVGIFAILGLAVLHVYALILNEIRVSREQTIVSFLANQYLEVARNLPYSNVGTITGNPHGNLPDLANPVSAGFGDNSYTIYYAVSYVDDPADGTILLGTDSAPTDYKQVKLYVTNASTNITKSFLTNVAPQGLEGLLSGGALFIKVFNAVGQPVHAAAIHIVNNNVSPVIDLTRISNENGDWVEVGLPDSVNGYHITATKSGYSQDQTYPITEQNPNPVKPDSTISIGMVTHVSFSIDRVSSLTFNVLNQTCQALSETGVEARGSKLIGTPNVLKFDHVYVSDSSGKILLNNLEWDNYTPAPTGSTYMIYGTSPVQQISVLPDTQQEFTLLLGPNTENSLLVIVKDSSTKNPIEGASVDLRIQSYEEHIVKITGGSTWSQQNWSGGSGQANFEEEDKYFEDDGGIGTGEVPSGLRLLKLGEYYTNSGTLTSSTFDTGTDSTFYTTLNWQPTSQTADTHVKFQIAGNNNNETWNFTGPDGTANSFYETAGITINEINNKRYVRYKAFLSTDDNNVTPVLTSINLNYVSGCFTPGQAMFPGIAERDDYWIFVSADNYNDWQLSEIDISGHNVLEVLLARQE